MHPDQQHAVPSASTPPTSDGATEHPTLVLRMRDVVKVHGNTRTRGATRALDRMSLEVYEREFISIMGPSGSGKTTLLNLLAGLDTASGGEVWLQGEDVSALSNGRLALLRRRQLGFVFQDFNLLDTLTLAENVALPLSLERLSSATIQQRVSATMQFLGIADQMHRYPYEVSGGEQQRAAVARAVVHQPRLLLADEPTGNLDSASARTLLELFQQLNRQRQATILMVTHDPFSASYSQRVVFIKDGHVFTQIQRNGSREQFFQSILNTLAHLEGSHELA